MGDQSLAKVPHGGERPCTRATRASRITIRYFIADGIYVCRSLVPSGRDSQNVNTTAKTTAHTMLKLLVLLIALVALASALCDKKRDLFPKVKAEDCVPSYGMTVRKCTWLMRRCECQLGISLKWMGPGCSPGTTRDGGCQCGNFCGYQCETKCKKDRSCKWDSTSKTCGQKVQVTQSSCNWVQTMSPTKSPRITDSPTFEPTSDPTTEPTASPSHEYETTEPTASPSHEYESPTASPVA